VGEVTCFRVHPGILLTTFSYNNFTACSNIAQSFFFLLFCIILFFFCFKLEEVQFISFIYVCIFIFFFFFFIKYNKRHAPQIINCIFTSFVLH
jgi:Ca2+/Na+ antiporter